MPEDLTHLLQLIEAHDQRHSERIQAFQEIMKSSLDAQKELTKRTEESYERRFQALYQFRDELRAMVSTLATKEEMKTMFQALSAMEQANRSRLDVIEGKTRGIGIAWSFVIGIVGLVAGIASTIMLISKGLI